MEITRYSFNYGIWSPDGSDHVVEYDSETQDDGYFTALGHFEDFPPDTVHPQPWLSMQVEGDSPMDAPDRHHSVPRLFRPATWTRISGGRPKRHEEQRQPARGDQCDRRPSGTAP